MATDMRTLLWGITAFSLSIIFFMFIYIFIYQMGDEYLLTALDNVSTQIEPQLGISATMSNYIHSIPEDYRNLNIPFDLIFLAVLVMAIGASVFATIRVQEEGWWSFFGILTIGMMIVLLISSYVSLVKDWLILNLFDNFLEVSIETMPFFYWWITHMALFNFIWALALILLNKMNFTYNRDYDVEEQQTINSGEFQR